MFLTKFTIAPRNPTGTARPSKNQAMEVWIWHNDRRARQPAGARNESAAAKACGDEGVRGRARGNSSGITPECGRPAEPPSERLRESKNASRRGKTKSDRRE